MKIKIKEVQNYTAWARYLSFPMSAWSSLSRSELSSSSFRGTEVAIRLQYLIFTLTVKFCLHSWIECLHIRVAYQSVDSLCRDGANTAILKQKPYNFTTNTLKAYLSAQASSLSAFVISNIHISGQKPCGRQLNAKVCDSKSAIFRILSYSFFVQTTCQATITRKRLRYSP